MTNVIHDDLTVNERLDMFLNEHEYNYAGTKNSFHYDIQYDVLSVYYRDLKSKIVGSAYNFQNFSLLTEPQQKQFLAKFEKFCDYISGDRNLKFHGYLIKPEHLPLLAVVLNNDRDLMVGELLLIETILSGRLTSVDFLEALLKFQAPTELAFLSVAYLLPIFNHFLSGRVDIRDVLTKAFREHSPLYYESLFKITTFIDESKSNPDVTWGEIQSGPFRFVEIPEIDTDFRNYLSLSNALLTYSDYLDNEDMRKVNFKSFVELSKFPQILEIMKPFYLKKISENNDFTAYESFRSSPHLLVSDENEREMFRKVLNDMYLAPTLFGTHYGYQIQTFAYVAETFGASVAIDLMNFLKVYENVYKFSFDVDFFTNIVKFCHMEGALDVGFEFGLRIEGYFPPFEADLDWF